MSTSQTHDHDAPWDRKMTPARVFAASLLPIILIVGAVWFYSTHPLPRFTITFVAADSQRVFSTLSPYGPGMDREMAERFCARYGLTPRWLKVKTPEEAWQALAEGRAQVMVGLGWQPDLAERNIARGPAYESMRPLLLSHQRRPLDILRPNICNSQVAVAPSPGLIGSLKAFGWEQECRATYSTLPTMALATLFRQQNEQSTLPYMLADRNEYALLAPFSTRIRVAAELPKAVDQRWYWRTDEHMLDKRMRAFFRRMSLSGQLDELKDRYFGFFPEARVAVKAAHFRSAISHRMPEHAASILAAARANDLDPLLLVAIIYQESGFMEDAVSHTGVRGLMQLTRETASRFGVADRSDPAQSIRYGSRYLKRIWQRLEPLRLDHWDRWFMTLASYNQGIGHIFDAMLLSKQLGDDPRKWINVARALKLLEQRRYHTQSIYGHTRGSEGVDYVNQVRFYYYVLKGWTSLPGLELDELALLRLSLDDLGLP